MRSPPGARGIWRFTADLPTTDPGPSCDARRGRHAGDPARRARGSASAANGCGRRTRASIPRSATRIDSWQLAMTRALEAGVAVGRGRVNRQRRHLRRRIRRPGRAPLRGADDTRHTGPAPPLHSLAGCSASLRRRFGDTLEIGRSRGARVGLVSVDQTWTYRPAARTRPACPAYKTLAYEIAEQTGIPDVVAAPLALGDLLAGLHQGFEELRASGRTDRLPRLVGVAPEEETSVAYNVGSQWLTKQAQRAVEATGGEFLKMPEAEILPLRERLARSCGVFAEASSVLSVWGACHAAESAGSAVAVVTSSGLKDPLPGDAELPALDPIENSLDALEAAPPQGVPCLARATRRVCLNAHRPPPNRAAAFRVTLAPFPTGTQGCRFGAGSSRHLRA